MPNGRHTPDGFPQSLGPLLVDRCTTLPTVRGDPKNLEWSMPRIGPLEPLNDAGLRCSGKLSEPGRIPKEWGSMLIPPGATTVAWAYPDEQAAQIDLMVRERLEGVAEVDFVTFGGFLYFSQTGVPLAAVSIQSQAGGWDAPVGLLFDGPFSWPAGRTERLLRADRFFPISIKQFRDNGARWFCWILPGERLEDTEHRSSGHIICPAGGFAYLFSDDPAKSSPRDCYFRVTRGLNGELDQMMKGNKNLTNRERFELVDFNSTQGKGVVLRHNRLKYNRMTLLAVPTMMALAKEMEREAPGLFLMGDMKFEAFGDGTPNLFVNASLINGYDVVLICDYDVHKGGQGWLANLSLIYEIPRYGARSLTVVLPFFPVGTMERISVEGEIPTAASFARMLSATPMTTQGPTRFVFFDLHALQNRFYFTDQVMPHLNTAIPLLRREMECIEEQGEKVAVAFPDDGAKKRFGPLFSAQADRNLVEAYPLIVCSKQRGPGDVRKFVITEGAGAVRGRHVVIVDDLVQSGGTMLGCKDLMYDSGASNVSGFVTHGVFPKGSWKKFLVCNTPPGKKPWTNFLITDSVPGTVENVQGQKPFRVLSLAPRIVDLLGGIAPHLPPTRGRREVTEIVPTPHASPIPAHRSSL